MKTAFLFPGQGAQYVGMGAELREGFPAARAIFERALSALGPEYIDVIFAGPEEKLRQTRFTQVAIYVVSMAAHEVLKQAGVQADFAAGHSLGEYSALAAAGAFDFETGLGLVRARGEAIGDAADKTRGTMAAIVGLERLQVLGICRQAASLGVCEAVNFNCPGQVVIAGVVPAVEEAVKLAQAAGAAKSMTLSVSGAFHSTLMKPAAERMAQVLATARIEKPRIPVVMNVDARATVDPEEIRQRLVSQVDHPVLWEDGLQTFFGLGVDQFIEVGPGRVLSGMVRRTDKTKKFSNIEDKKSAEKFFAPVG